MAETKELYQQEVYVNRQYKDRLFKFVFKEKEDLLQCLPDYYNLYHL